MHFLNGIIIYQHYMLILIFNFNFLFASQLSWTALQPMPNRWKCTPLSTSYLQWGLKAPCIIQPHCMRVKNCKRMSCCICCELLYISARLVFSLCISECKEVVNSFCPFSCQKTTSHLNSNNLFSVAAIVIHTMAWLDLPLWSYLYISSAPLWSCLTCFF